MNYIISVGYIRSIKTFKEKIPSLLEIDNDGKGLGIHRLFPKIEFNKLDTDISDDERYNIFDKYQEVCDTYFRDVRFTEKSWVTHSKITPYRGSNVRVLSNDFIEEFKSDVKGGREFFRAIKDAYVDNDTKPNIEVCMINTQPIKESLKMISNSALNNDLKAEQIDFIKWVYWWFVKILSEKGDLALVRFHKDR